jgi:hypothetical protein
MLFQGKIYNRCIIHNASDGALGNANLIPGLFIIGKVTWSVFGDDGIRQGHTQFLKMGFGAGVSDGED